MGVQRARQDLATDQQQQQQQQSLGWDRPNPTVLGWPCQKDNHVV